MAGDSLDSPPFPPLHWDNTSWSGEVVLPSWAGFQDRSGSYASVGAKSPSDGTFSLSVDSAGDDDEGDDEVEETPPTPEQAAAFQYLMDHESEVAAAVGRALVEYYAEAKQAYLASPYSDESLELPDVSNVDDLRPLIGLSGVHVLTVTHDGSAYIGFEFGCVWDDEHGAGVMTHRGRVIQAGQADMSFVEWVAELDPERPAEPE